VSINFFIVNGPKNPYNGGKYAIQREIIMKNSIKIRDMESGQSVEGFFLVREREIRQTKAGKEYISLVIQDDTGTVDAKIWDNAEKLANEFSAGDLVKIQAQVGTYRDNLDLSVRRLRAASPEDNLEITDFMPRSPYDTEEMAGRLRGILDAVQEPFIRRLLDSFLEDEGFMEEFTRMPASKMIHHPYAGGLLEHTLSVLEILTFLSSHYSGLDRDRLLAGGFLHDIGKMREISSEPDGSYTDEGILLGHMVIGARMVAEKIGAIESFPPELETEMLHMVVSHQGEPDWGSPIVPMTREALIVHFTDNLDAKQFVAQHALEEFTGEGSFTQKIYPLNRPFYRRPASGSGTLFD
jgi:3'-5' exoribonuclease